MGRLSLFQRTKAPLIAGHCFEPPVLKPRIRHGSFHRWSRARGLGSSQAAAEGSRLDERLGLLFLAKRWRGVPPSPVCFVRDVPPTLARCCASWIATAMSCTQVRAVAASTVGDRDDVVGGQWVVGMSGVSADPAHSLLTESLLPRCPILSGSVRASVGWERSLQSFGFTCCLHEPLSNRLPILLI